MDFELPPEDDPRRLAVRNWIATNPDASPADVARAGYVVPGWPAPWGLDADAVHRLIIGEELEKASVALPDNPIGIGWAGPTILAAGSGEQKERYLWPLLTGEECWCQLFSEPNAGSDLAGLQTRAVRDGDEYVVNGQKIWTTWADRASFGVLLARTDPDAPKHRGISYFICPMDDPGVEVRPIVEMTGNQHFSEVFLTDVRIPAANLIGVENGGWPLARITLGNERMSLSEGGVLWGMGPKTGDLIDLARGHDLNGPQRDRLVTLHIEAEVMRFLGLRIVSDLVHGREPGPEMSVKKFLADRHGQKVMQLANQMSGAGGLLTDAGPLGEEAGEWPWGFLFSPALTIGGGTTQVLSNIIGERILGLPREPKPV